MGLIRGNRTNKFEIIDPVINLICNELDNDQKFKRLVAYLTKSPLKNKGLDNSGNIIYQRDIHESIMKKIKICVDKDEKTQKQFIDAPKILIPYIFEEDNINENYVSIYVHNYLNNLNEIVGDNIFRIDVLVPIAYNQLEPYGNNRLHEILKRIAELFDGAMLDEESQREIGRLKFDVCGVKTEQKISRTNDILVYTVDIKTRVINKGF